MIHLLYNGLADNRHGEENTRAFAEKVLANEDCRTVDFVSLENLDEFLDGIAPEDQLILSGGDGTLNRFVNMIGDREFAFPVCYLASGSGNDFLRDVEDKKDERGLVLLNDYIRDLPTVTVNGKDYRFLNGIGYGIDGYCCEVGDRFKTKSDKPVNYAGIAIKGLLFHYKRPNATVTVDGEAKSYRRVWLAPTMNGRFYGGGMMIAPAQDRLDPEKKLTVVVMHRKNKLGTLIVFPKIFKGEHVKHHEMIDVREGKTVTVTFDRPTALQIDGETILGVTEYTAKSFAEKHATV